MKEKERENAVNEIRILASIKDDYIIGYKDAFYDESSSTLNVVMEYASGGDILKKIN
jgi:NIMA (never in mitosis gene a)-related kinase